MITYKVFALCENFLYQDGETAYSTKKKIAEIEKYKKDNGIDTETEYSDVLDELKQNGY